MSSRCSRLSRRLSRRSRLVRSGKRSTRSGAWSRIRDGDSRGQRLTLLVAMLVLGGRAGGGHVTGSRRRGAKTLGATRGQSSSPTPSNIRRSALPPPCSSARGRPPAAFVLNQVMNLPFGWLPGPALRSPWARSPSRSRWGSPAPSRAWPEARPGAAKPLIGPAIWSKRGLPRQVSKVRPCRHCGNTPRPLVTLP